MAREISIEEWSSRRLASTSSRPVYLVLLLEHRRRYFACRKAKAAVRRPKVRPLSRCGVPGG